MKNYRFQNPNNKGSISRLHSKQQPAKIQKQSASSNRIEAEREKKRLELQKEMKMLQQKIKDKDSTIKQTGKLLDIDDFLKKQKEKTKEYALKLSEQYQKQKKDREVKLYKKYGRQDANSQKLITGTIKSEIPLNIFTAIDQIKRKDSNIDKWVVEGHYHKLDDLLIDKNCDLFNDSLKQQEENCLKSSKENTWKRIKEVSTNQSLIRYLPVKSEQNQLQPSDCCEALMASLNLMPEQLSQYLYRQNQGVNKQIFFSLKFFPGGQVRTVFTDQWIEVRQFKHKYVNISSRHKNQLTFWSTIIDKSFRKLHLGQKSLKNLNETLLTVFGVDGQIIPFSNKCIIKENFRKVINFLLSNVPKALIGFINDKSDTPDRIFPLKNVQYPVVVNKKKKKGEIISQQLPKSQQEQYIIINPYTTLLKSDYINKFTINQLCQYFNKIVLIRDYPDKWGGNRIKIQFLSNGPISFTGSEWLKNNQYSFTISRNVEVRVAMRRGWGRVPETTQDIQQQKLNYGFILFRSYDGQTQISCMKLQNLIGKCKRTDLNGAVLNKALEKGTYVVIPFSHIVSQQYMQSFNLDILLEKEEVLTINKAKMYEYFYDNKNTAGEKIVQKLQSRIKYQRPKIEKIVPHKISLPSKKKGIQDQIESLNLILKGEVKLTDFPIPGKLQSFLVFGQIAEQKRQRKQVKSGQQLQIEKYQRQQWLRILLGYDSISGEDINIGQMREIAEQTSDILDFSDFELTDEGFMAILETLMVLPRISTLKLDRNNLTDSSITYLCYYLQKGNRNQLKKLTLSGNKIGASGIRAIQGLKKRLTNLQVSGIKI